MLRKGFLDVSTQQNLSMNRELYRIDDCAIQYSIRHHESRVSGIFSSVESAIESTGLEFRILIFSRIHNRTYNSIE